MFRRKYSKIHNLFSSNENKVIRIDKKGKEITKTISFRLKFLDSVGILLKEFIKLYVNTNTIIKNVKFDENLKKQFFDTYKFILLLRGGVYPYEYTDDW